MKQVFQDLKGGIISVEEVPTALVRPGHLLVQTRYSLISAGTERMLVEFGRASLLAKARQQPEKVKQVIEKIKSDGLLPTLEAVFSRLDEPLPLGYCNAGVVLEVGPGVRGFAVGDRVASNGPHAEVVLAPQTLCARIPDSVSDEEAAFTPLGAVALQGVRLLEPQLGDRVVVTGLGLVGLLTAQLLLGSGCQVLGLDYDPARVALAESFGARAADLSAGSDAVGAAEGFSEGRGVDGVLIAASTQSSEPIHQAAGMCRKRGRIVLLGVAGLRLSRADFYEKELTFQVSCSYGPGRYDPAYEHRGQDYPFGYVRWTAQRNFEAVLGALGGNQLQVKPLISHQVALHDASKAYDIVTQEPSSLGVVLEYPAERPETASRVAIAERASTAPASEVVAGLIGAGNYARATLLPALRTTGAHLRTIADINGVNARHLGDKFGFEAASTDYREILADPEINLVFIATRHDQHAHMVMEALRAGKHVFVEKPLCLSREELAEIKHVYQEVAGSDRPRRLMVGFNRRFAPHVVKIRELLARRTQPLAMTVLVNAGPLPAGHWLNDPAVGGGRLIGEGCHFIDLLRHLAGSAIASVSAAAMGNGEVEARRESSVTTLKFQDGSLGTIQYFANGDRSFPKERVEILCGGRLLALDNFRNLRGYGHPNFRRMHLRKQDKGHRAQFQAVVNTVVEGGPPLIPFEEMEEVTLASFDAAEQVGAV